MPETQSIFLLFFLDTALFFSEGLLGSFVRQLLQEGDGEVGPTVVYRWGEHVFPLWVTFAGSLGETNKRTDPVNAPVTGLQKEKGELFEGIVWGKDLALCSAKLDYVTFTWLANTSYLRQILFTPRIKLVHLGCDFSCDCLRLTCETSSEYIEARGLTTFY